MKTGFVIVFRGISHTSLGTSADIGKEGLVQRRVSWYNGEDRKNFKLSSKLSDRLSGKMPGKMPGGWKRIMRRSQIF